MNVCSRHEIPLYLMVTGFILIVEIIFQTSLCIAIKRKKRHETTYRALRMCDCLALFLFIWLLVGTYWMFTISIQRQHCMRYGNDGVYVNTTVTPTVAPTVTPDTGTQMFLWSTPSTTASGDSSNTRCLDCESYVYNYTAFVIMLQYIITLAVMIFCCSFYIKVRGQR